jgi:RNA polymerase sigma-70 factor (ECF subfamily)
MVPPADTGNRSVADDRRDVIRALHDRARSRHATITVELDEFTSYLLARISPETPLEALYTEDLYLACACARGDDHAIAVLDQRVVAAARAATARHRASPEAADEVTQQLRARLLVAAPDRALRIVEYAGRGTLDSWLRVAAVRLSLNLRRDRRCAERRAPEGFDLLPLSPDLEVLRRQVQRPFGAAFREAFRTLANEDRVVLRLHFKAGVNLHGIAAVLGVSRATAGRRLQTARERLRNQTIRLLGGQLAAESGEIESILRTLSGELDVSTALATLVPEAGPAVSHAG